MTSTTKTLIALALFVYGCGDDDGSGDGGAADSSTSDGALPPPPPMGVALPADSAIRLMTPQSELVAPGDTVEVSVQLVDGDGEPLADLPMLFLAPELGPSGSFGGELDFVLEAMTDEQGMASATLTVGEGEGAFLVDALVRGSGVSVSVAVSAWNDMPEPTSSAAQVRTWAEDQDLAMTSRSKLHGPFLLPSGAVVSVGGGEPSTVDEQAAARWLLWFDSDDLAKYEHETQFFVLDAMAEELEWTESTHEAWPDLAVANGEESWALLRPARRNVTWPALPEMSESDDSEVGSASSPLGDLMPGHCAVLASGGEFTQDVDVFERFFRDDYRAEHVYRKESAASAEEVLEMMTQARDAGCSKIFLLLSGHGLRQKASNCPSHIFLDDESERQPCNAFWCPEGDEETVDHGWFASHFEDIIGERDIEMQIIVDSCFAELAVAQYQGRGFSGGIHVAAVTTQTSTAIDGASIFPHLLVDYWQRSDGTIDDAMDALQEAIDSRDWDEDEPGEKSLAELQRQMPGSHPIQPGFRDWDHDAPMSLIPDSETVAGGRTSITIERPMSIRPGSPPVNCMELQFEIDTPAVVEIVGEDHRIPFDRPDTSIDLRGLQVGAATYTVTSRSRFDAYRGSGMITVEGNTAVCPGGCSGYTIRHVAEAGPDVDPADLNRIDRGWTTQINHDGLVLFHGTIASEGVSAFIGDGIEPAEVIARSGGPTLDSGALVSIGAGILAPTGRSVLFPNRLGYGIYNGSSISTIIEPVLRPPCPHDPTDSAYDNATDTPAFFGGVAITRFNGCGSDRSWIGTSAASLVAVVDVDNPAQAPGFMDELLREDSIVGVNRNGDVFFVGDVRNGGGGIFRRSSGGSYSLVARRGQMVGPGEELGFSGGTFVPSSLSVNDSGAVAFVSRLLVGANVLVVSIGGNLTRIAGIGDSVPDALSDAIFQQFDMVHITADNQVIFRALVQGSTIPSGSGHGLFRWADGVLEGLMMPGELAPDTASILACMPDGCEFTHVEQLAVGAAGHIAMVASFDGSSRGLYIMNPCGTEFTKVAGGGLLDRQGIELEGGESMLLNFDDLLGGDNDPLVLGDSGMGGRGMSINDQGELVVRAQQAGGDRVIIAKMCLNAY